jgi:hypothetical protein
VVVKDPALPASEYRIACDGAALEIEAEPLKEAAERKDVDGSIEPNVAPEGFHRSAAEALRSARLHRDPTIISPILKLNTTSLR